MNTQRKSKTKKRIITSIIIIAVVVTAARFILRPAHKSYESAKAKISNITTYDSFSGNVETKNRQTVMSEKMMQISDIKVKNGDIVKAGDVLIKTASGDEIKSKISGEVANVNVEENSQVMAGVELLEIVDYNNLDVNVKVDEYDIGALENGKEAIVNIGAINKEVKGKISSISKEGQIVNGVTFFPATIDLNKDDKLRIGMSAEVKVIRDKATGVITLPMKAIQFDNDNNPYVLKNGKKGSVIKTKITTGINDGTLVEIKKGVSNGETILYTNETAAATTSGFGFGNRKSVSGGSSNSSSGSANANSSNSNGNMKSTNGGGN